jgi:hypothetical protein
MLSGDSFAARILAVNTTLGVVALATAAAMGLR